MQFKEWEQQGPLFYQREQAVYITPLACESRAFARLDSHGKNGVWAVKCYGWMKMTDTQFKVIKRLVRAYDRRFYHTMGYYEKTELSRWVIVKDYIPTETDQSHATEKSETLAIPKALRIYPGDARPENYRGSKLVDLSCASTFPCPGWSELNFKHFFSEIPDHFADEE